MDIKEALDILVRRRPEYQSSLPSIYLRGQIRRYKPDEESQWIDDKAQWSVDHHLTIGGHRLTLEEAKEDARQQRAELRARVERAQGAYDLAFEVLASRLALDATA